jgi:hypothetical protein
MHKSPKKMNSDNSREQFDIEISLFESEINRPNMADTGGV